MEEIDNIDAKISDFVGTDNDIALGIACGNCRHKLHANKAVCKAFTRVRTMWNSCDCTESTIGFKINVKVRVKNDEIRNETNSINSSKSSPKPKQFIPLSEIFNKK